MTSGGVLSSPGKLEALMSAATSALTLDSHTSIAELRGLAIRMRDVTTRSIHTITLPTHAPTRAEGGIGDSGELPGLGAVQIYNSVDLERIAAPLRAPRDNGVRRPPPASAAPGTPAVTSATPTLSADQITVAVYNGSTVTGLASRAVTALIRQGFRASNEGNASSHTYTGSKIVYGPGWEAAARALQAAVPGAELQPELAATRLQLIVGSSFSGLVPGSVGGQPSGGVPIAAAGAGSAGSSAPASGEPAPPAPAEAPTCTY
jgi:hypothetical protein